MASSDQDSLEVRYSLHLQSVGVDPRSLQSELDGTVRSDAGRHPTWTPEVRALPAVTLGEPADARAELTVVRLLGMGGMGKVMLAVQRALDREVAIKQLRTPEPSGEASTALLREALVTGRLEHPNIVPVHQLAQGSDGAPFFVMKRIEGIPWSALLRAPQDFEKVGRRGGEPLLAHLSVFQEVCDAVAFAHSKGVLHRDLKPDNVMVGAFGEIYVLDWGIAVSVNDDPHLPRAADVKSVSGTPAYMAPEMAGAVGLELGPRTDVYLLGAVLHELLTGEPPHQAGTVLASLLSAWDSEPRSYPPQVPLELAQICRTAMAKDAAQRFESVEALQRAVATFLEHRDAWALCGEATQRLHALSGLVAQERAGKVVDAVAVQTAATECRFGFEQALRRWADMAAAREGLELAKVCLVEHEVLRDNAPGARALLAELAAPPPALVRQLEELEARLAQRTERMATLEKLERETDLDVGLIQRGRQALGVAVVAALVSFAVGFLVRRGLIAFEHPQALLATGTFALASLIQTELFRRRVALNEAQRRLLRGNLAALLCFVAYWVLAWWVAVPFDAAMVQFMFLVASLWLAAALLFDRRGLTVAVAFGVAAVAAGALPGAQIELFGLALLFGFGGLGLAWRKPRSDSSPRGAP